MKKVLNDLMLVCQNEFEEIGDCVTERSLKQFKSGMFWSGDKERFLSDEDIIIPSIEMARRYYKELKCSDMLKDNEDNLEGLFKTFWDEDENYISVELLRDIYL